MAAFLENLVRNLGRSFSFSPATPLIMEAANLYAGDQDPAASNHLTLTELRLPSLEKNYVDHAPGGSPVAIEVETHLNRLEATFTLAGWQPHILKLLRNTDETFTVYGLLRNRMSGRAMQAQAVMQGRLGRATPSVFSRGVVQTHEYMIRSIMHYALTVEGEQVFYWDFFEKGTATVQQGDDEGALLQRLYPGVIE